VVDDDDGFRDAATRLLRSAGYEVWAAPDYQVALTTLESDRQIDLLMIDIVMPGGVNGLALARMARLRRSHIAVIYVSGYDIPGLDGEALGPVYPKPIDDDALLAAIARALPRQQ
jgi:hypothetical protein